MAGFKARSSEGNDGFIWGGALLAFALMFVWLFVEDVRDAESSAPTLSPTSIGELELDEHQELLVDVEGFEIDCDNATYHDERLLAPGFAPDRPAMILVGFEHGSDCRESVAELRGPFRAKAKAMSVSSKLQLGIDTVGVKVAIVEPHHTDSWVLILVLFFGGIGVFGVQSGLRARRKLARPRAEPAIAPEAAEPDDRRPSDPYRPGKSGRLIPEPLAPAPAMLTALLRVRRLSIALGVVALVGATTWASFGGMAIAEREHVWSTGVVAKDAIAQGQTRRSLLLLVSTDLDVTFVDHTGQLHREEASALSLIVGVNDDVPPTVRYLPDDPERFAVSWIHEQLWGSLAILVLGVGGLIALGVALIVSARRDRKPEQARAVFADPREALLELMSSERQVVNGSDAGITHHFLVRDSDRTWSHFVGVDQPGPLFLDPAHSVALALYHPRDPDYLLVLSEDLHELDRPPFTPAQLRGRFEAASKGSDA